MRPILCKWCHEQLQRSYWSERWVHIKTQDALCWGPNGRLMTGEPFIEDVEL